MTYNILADKFAASESFPSAAAHNNLSWSIRYPKIISDVKRVAPSILCMQEVQTHRKAADPANHIDAITFDLGDMGYTGMPVRKNSKNSIELANCIFWRADEFTLVDSRPVYYAKMTELVCAGDKKANQYFSSNHTALIVCLAHVPTGRHVVVCTTHIWCNFTDRVCQTFQSQLACIAIREYITYLKDTKGVSDAGVVVAGDFNANERTGVYEFMTTGHLDFSHEDGHAKKDPGMKVPLTAFQHGLSLSSVYAAAMGQEPACTTVRGDYVAVLDFIFFQPARLTVSAVLALPTASECAHEGGMPNTRHGSDHIPIAARFSFV